MLGKNFYYATLIVGITAVLTIAITLKLSRSRSATPVPPALDAALLARATTPADEYGGAQKEGIKVHGHWSIDVRNPDGTLVTHRDFENGLTLTGRATLVSLLGRQKTNGGWLVELASFSGTSACENSNSVQDACDLYEANAPFTAPNFFKTLTLSLPTSGSLMLSGSATAARVGTIDLVNTAIYTCPWGDTTQVCSYPGVNVFSNQNNLTSKQLAQPVNGVCPDPACAVNVVAGQIIQVTVVISFS